MDKLIKLNSVNLFAITFLFIIFSSLIVQQILLPYILPQWHAYPKYEDAYGLLLRMDMKEFHLLAIEQYRKVKEYGWSHFNISPSGHEIAGIASFLYLIFYPSIFIITIVNGILHGIVSVLLFKILLKLNIDKLPAFFAVLILSFFPSSLLWNTQIHNEPFFITGTIFISYSLFYIIPKNNDQIKYLFYHFVFFLIGISLVFLVRPYFCDVILYLSSLLYFFIIINSFINIRNKKLFYQKIIILVLAIFIFTSNIHIYKTMRMINLTIEFIQNIELSSDTNYLPKIIKQKQTSDEKQEEELIIKEDNQLEKKENIFLKRLKNIKKDPIYLQDIYNYKWDKNEILPNFIETLFLRIAVYRHNFYPNIEENEESSAIDRDINFHNAFDVMKYIPKALLIGIFSPFPNQWFSSGSLEETSFFKKIYLFEVILIYFFISIGFFLVFKKLFDIYFIIISFYNISLIILIALLTPNIGTLLRHRYGFIVVIFAILISLVIEKFLKKINMLNDNKRIN
ncbi:hypothetical protein N9U91_04630 [Pelagibacteraceae bacterium]|nr:hypothetical protein [Pelagibacteraceae bacterium]